MGLDQRFGPVFQRVFYLVQELVGHSAVHYAVIVAQCDVAHGADGDGIVDDYRALFDGAKAENADVGLADDRQSEQAAENSWIGYGKGSFLHFFRTQLLSARALGQVVHVALDAENVLFVGVLDHRNDEAPIEGYGNAHVDFLVQNNVGSIERSVQRWKRAQAVDRSLHEKWH